MLSNFFSPRKSYRLWDNEEKYGRARQGHRWQYDTAHALCATNTHSEYVMLIAFPRQKLLRERASLLLCKDTACIVKNIMAVSIASTGLRLWLKILTFIL